jgi:hypothetical protein
MNDNVTGAQPPKRRPQRRSAAPPEPTPVDSTVNGAEAPQVTGIAKPAATFNLDQFKSKNITGIANVAPMLMALPHHSISQAGDFVRLHPSEEHYWSDELCFVNVPIKGMTKDTIHLITRELVETYLGNMPKRVKLHRLALASRPYDVCFLCHVPSSNLDNKWNQDALRACHEAQRFWVQVNSRRAEQTEGYKIDYARNLDAFPQPLWLPKHSLDEIIAVSFAGRMITDANHPALLRLIGGSQSTT